MSRWVSPDYSDLFCFSGLAHETEAFKSNEFSSNRHGCLKLFFPVVIFDSQLHLECNLSPAFVLKQVNILVVYTVAARPLMEAPPSECAIFSSRSNSTEVTGVVCIFMHSFQEHVSEEHLSFFPPSTLKLIKRRGCEWRLLVLLLQRLPTEASITMN